MVSGAIIIGTKDGPVQYNTIHYTEIESQCMHCQTVEELSTPLMVSATHCRYEVIRVDVVPVSESHVLKPMGLRTGPSGWLPACLYVIQININRLQCPLTIFDSWLLHLFCFVL